ncbi:MAG: hypothetical protein WAU78_01560 [Roseiarcus sp.]
MADIHFDEAFDILIQRITAISKLLAGPMAEQVRNNASGSEVVINKIIDEYWRGHSPNTQIDESNCPPFYDAAWELARIGVLRPGRHNSSKQHFPSGGFDGASFSITEFGHTWLQDASTRPVSDPSRWSEMLRTFAPHFGGGFSQRATEAVRTYRTANYLAACVMAGAAAESILLAIAITKSGYEAKTLAQYNSRSGRREVTKSVVGNVSTPVKTQFETALQILHYWRDDAAHGMATTISEMEAFASLSQLLRLAQFADDHWAELTRR